MKRIFLGFLIVFMWIWASSASGMICLDNTDTLEGGASVAAVVDYTAFGLVGSTFTNIAQGQLSATDPSVLYTAGAGISVVSVVFVNTHSAAVTVNLYLDPANAGTPRRLIPKNLSLGAGYSMVFDGQRCSVLDDSGGLLSSYAGTIGISQGGTGQTTASAAFDALKQDATDSATGVVELATDAGTVTGTATDRVVTPANLTAKMAAPGAIGGTTPSTGAFTEITSPTIVGGSGTASDLYLKATSGVGTTGADIHLLVGNNGATEAQTILNNGHVGIGGSPSEIFTVFGTNYDPEILVSSSGAAYIEFARDGHTVRGSVGALGGFEMNIAYNMDYSTEDHKYYDSTKDAFWLTFQDGGMLLQHAVSGSTAADIWYAVGDLPFAVTDDSNTILGTAGTTLTDHGETLQVLGDVYIAGGPMAILSTTTQPQIKLTSSTTGSTAIYFGDTDASFRGMLKYDNSGDYFSVSTATSEQMRITSGGTVGINETSPDSNTKLDVDGVVRAQSGIQPNGNAYAANEVLDDYEEGTYVATVTCSTSGSYTLDAGFNQLAYTKIGRQVSVTGRLVITGESSPSGDLRISLPFTVDNLDDDSGRATGSCILANHGGTISGQLNTMAAEDVSYMVITELSSAGALSNINDSDVDSAFYIYVEITYFTS